MQLLLTLLQLPNKCLALDTIKANALVCHVHEHRENIGFQFKNGFHFLFAQLGLHVVPQLQGQRGVLLSVVAHIHGREFPKLFLGMHAEVAGGLFQALLRLDFFEIVKAKGVQGEGVAVLINQGRCEHGIEDPAVDLEP